MSALPPIADTRTQPRDVRFVPEADIAISSAVPVNSSILRRQGLDPEALSDRFHLSTLGVGIFCGRQRRTE